MLAGDGNYCAIWGDCMVSTLEELKWDLFGCDVVRVGNWGMIDIVFATRSQT
jgi:hypothetical protein